MNIPPASYPSQMTVQNVDEDENFFEHSLPDEMWQRIFFYLSLRDLAVSQLTCRRWKELAADNLLWKFHLYHYFPSWSSKLSLKERDYKRQLCAQFNIKSNRAKVIDITDTLARKGHSEEIYSTFSPTGEQILVQEKQRHRVSIWDVQTRKCLIYVDQKPDMSVLFSPDGHQLAVISSQHFSLLNVKTGKSLVACKEWSTAPKFSPDGQLLATINSKSICLWDTQASALIQRWESKPGHSCSVQFSPGSHRVIVKAFSSIFLWDTLTNKMLKDLKKGKNDLNACFSPDGKRLLIYGCLSSAYLRDAQTGKKLHALEDSVELESNPLFSANSKRLIASKNNCVRLWDVQRGTCLKKAKTQLYSVGVSFSPNSKWVIVSDEHEIQLWEASTGKCVQCFKKDDWQVRTSPLRTPPLLFSSNSERIVTHTSNSVHLWEAGTGKCLRELQGESSTFEAIFSPDGKRVAILEDETNSYKMHVWDAQTGESLSSTELKNPEEEIFTAAFSPCSQWIVVSTDKETRVWEAKIGQSLYTLNDSSKKQEVSFSPDGEKWLIGTKIFDFSGSQLQEAQPMEVQPIQESAYSARKRKPSDEESLKNSSSEAIQEVKEASPSPKQKKKKES